MLKTIWIKSVVLVPVGYFVFTNQMKGLILSLMMIVAIDTFLGVSVSIRAKVFQSRRLRKFTNKITYYGATLLVFYIVSMMDEKLNWVFSLTTMFLILTEFFSVIEKLAFLGVQLPMNVISKINQEFKNISPSIRNKEELREFLNKRNVD